MPDGFTQITRILTADLAEEAEASGLFTPGTLDQIMYEAIKRRKTDRLFDIRNRLAGVEKGALTEADVTAKIHANRAEKRSGHISGR